MDEENCGNCKFVLKDEATAQLFCRRYPPTLVMSLGSDILSGAIKPRIGSHYPPTTESYWCGCYQVKETVQ